jgi:carbon monoxide dehydrogenase subunit G
MVRFEGSRNLASTPSVVWARLVDPSFLVTCLPDLDRVEQLEPEGARFVLRPGLSFVRGTLQVGLTILEKVPHSSVHYRLNARGIGSSSTVEVVLSLVPQDSGTTLGYVAQVTELGGLLKLVPGGLITGAAQKVVADVLAHVEKNLSPG